jgi:hypothetical protein
MGKDILHVHCCAGSKGEKFSPMPSTAAAVHEIKISRPRHYHRVTWSALSSYLIVCHHLAN